MTDVSNQKRMAADILDCGERKVWIDPEELEEVSNAITRTDVRRLIREGTIREKDSDQQSRGRARELQKKKKKGRKRGPGKQKGGKRAGTSKKKEWIETIRPIRKKLKELREQDALEEGAYRNLYKMAKAGAFRSTSHLELYMEEEGLKE